MMPGLVDKPSRVRNVLHNVTEDKDQLTTEYKVVLAIGLEHSGLKTATGSFVGFLHELEAHADVTKGDLKIGL